MISTKFPIQYILPILLLVSGSCTNQQTDTPAGEENPATQQEEIKTIVFFGNSLTAGLGVEEEQAFPALIQEKIDSLGLNYQVVNAGVSGETTAGGRNRVSWILKQHVDIFVLELGANDGLRGLPLEQTRKNLQAIIDTVQNTYPDAEIVMAGMQIPPNMGKEYSGKFRKIYPELAEENDTHLIPFILDGVGGVRELNQEDGIHPTAEGHKVIAGNVWEVLSGILQKEKAG